MNARCVWSAVALLVWLAPDNAAATSCTGEYSTCIDANALWPHPGEQRFFSVASPMATSPRQIALAVQAQALLRPITLDVPGPSAGGREVRVVDYAVDQTLLLEFGAGYGFSAGFVASLIAFQRGAGSGGIAAQRGDPLPRSAPRDPRLSLAYSQRLGATLLIEPRFELCLPLGDTEAYASSGALTAVPALALGARFGRFHVGVDAALRLRRSVELGTGRLASQAAVALGLSADLLESGALFVSGEAFALPALGSSTSRTGKRLGIESTWVPAEWLLSVGVRPESDVPWAVVAGAGSALALSSESSPGGSRTFAAPTSSPLRMLITLRYDGQALEPSSQQPLAHTASHP